MNSILMYSTELLNLFEEVVRDHSTVETTYTFYYCLYNKDEL